MMYATKRFPVRSGVRRMTLLALATVAASGAFAAPKGAVEKPSAAVVAAVPAELDGQTVYQVLLAEIGLHRGNAELAVSAYADAAQRTGDPSVLIRAIQIAGKSARPDVALELARRWVQATPDSTHARQTLTGMLGAFGRIDEMMVQWRQLMQRDAENAGRHLLQLNRLLSGMTDRQAALSLVSQVAADYPTYAEAQYALALAALAAGEQVPALAAIRQAQLLKPDWAQPLLLETQMLGREGATLALQRLDEFLQRQPEADEVALQRGRLLAAERRWPEARKAFDALRLKRPDSTEVLYPLAIVQLQQHDYPAAEASLRALLDNEFPDRSMVFYHLGLVAEERKDRDAALAAYGQVRGGEYDFQARLRAARIMAAQGRRDDAQAALKAISPQTAEERVRVAVTEAQILREQNNFKAAFDRLSSALAGQPDEPDLLYDQAMIAERLDRVDILESNLHKVIALRPDNAHAYNALGYSLADRNQRLDEAQGLIRKALSLAPDDPFILDSMGWVLFRLGRADEALIHLQRAYGLRPDPEIAAHIGEVLWSINRRDEARQVWAEARRAHPENEVLLGVIQKFAP